MNYKNLKQIKQYIDDHWVEKAFNVNEVTGDTSNKLRFDFTFCTDHPKQFILHASDTYRLAQYALLIYGTMLLSEHPILQTLGLTKLDPETMISFIQMTRSEIRFKKPILNAKHIVLEIELAKETDKLASHELFFVDLKISLNDNAHTVESTFVVNMRLAKT